MFPRLRLTNSLINPQSDSYICFIFLRLESGTRKVAKRFPQRKAL